MHTRLFTAVVLGATLLLGRQALASGSYPGRPPQPPVAVDTDKYNTGKQIFTGKATLGTGAAGAAETQTTRLKDLQGRLPKAVQKTAKLPELAGKLSAEQMKALEYYLELRYKVK